MVCIIKGRKYNTDTARKVDYVVFNSEVNEYHEAHLYCKRTGEYFLYEDFGRCGERITPLTQQEANMWAQENLEVDSYEAEFGEITEDDSSVAMTLNLPRAAYDKLKRLALKSGEPVSKYLSKIIKNIKEGAE